MGKDHWILFYNGIINTLANSSAKIEAMLVHHGKIHALGVREELKREWQVITNSNQANLEEVDLHYHYIVPGFIDAHLHPITKILYKTYFNCASISNYQVFSLEFRQFCQKKSREEWCVAYNYNEQKFPPTDKRFIPTRQDLDAIDEIHPLLLYRYDLHIIALNSRAMEIIGISDHPIPLPSGFSGDILVDDQGIPTGHLTEDAMKIVSKYMTLPSSRDLQQAQNEFEEELSALGITAFGGVINEEELPIFHALEHLRNLSQDMALYFNVQSLDTLEKIRREFEVHNHPKSALEEKHIQVNGLKRFIDGSFGAHTALLHTSYSNSPTNSCGVQAYIPKKLRTEIEEAIHRRFDVIVHAIGDRANTEIIDLYESIIENKLAMLPEFYNKERKIRVRIEHASMLTSQNIQKMAHLGIIPVSQPEFIRSEYSWIENYLGRERLKILYPFKSIIDEGIPLAGSSDAPVESCDILAAIQDCIIRFGLNQSQALTFEQAIKLYTRHAAYAIGQESTRGSLEPGKFADFVVINQDLSRIPAEAITQSKILQTYHRGKCIFTAII